MTNLYGGRWDNRAGRYADETVNFYFRKFMTQGPEHDREESRLQAEEERIHRAQRYAVASRLVGAVYYLSGALEILLLLRFILRLTGANPANAFAAFIYALSNVFVAPFSTLFAAPAIEKAGTFDVSALVAIAVYALLAWLAAKLVWLIWGPPT